MIEEENREFLLDNSQFFSLLIKNSLNLLTQKLILR